MSSFSSGSRSGWGGMAQAETSRERTVFGSTSRAWHISSVVKKGWHGIAWKGLKRRTSWRVLASVIRDREHMRWPATVVVVARRSRSRLGVIWGRRCANFPSRRCSSRAIWSCCSAVSASSASASFMACRAQPLSAGSVMVPRQAGVGAGEEYLPAKDPERLRGCRSLPLALDGRVHDAGRLDRHRLHRGRRRTDIPGRDGRPAAAPWHLCRDDSALPDRVEHPAVLLTGIVGVAPWPGTELTALKR